MATPKLNYAHIRAAQRKNKSMHEVKDLLPKNLNSNPLYYPNQSPLFPSDHLNRPSTDYQTRIKGTYSLFEEPAGSSNQQLYSKSLFGPHKEELIRHEDKLARGHSRVKSSITEMYHHKNVEIPEEDESVIGGATFGRFEQKDTRGKYDTLYGTESVGLADRLDEDLKIAREKWREHIKQRDERGLGGSGQAKERRTLSDFLKRDGGFGKETTSPEELRPRKKELVLEQDQGEDIGERKNGVRLYGERSPKNNSIEENMSQKEKGDFLVKLDNYIEYFKKSERTHRRASKGEKEMLGMEDRGKSVEEGIRDGEIRAIKKHVDNLNYKVKEVMKANKKILKEFCSMLIREDENAQKLEDLVEEFSSLKRRNKKYREKLKATNHLLEKERIDNQNNLLALKKVLSSGVNMVLENKIKKYMDGHKEKQMRSDVGTRDWEMDYKRKEEKYEKGDWKERKSSEKRQSVKKEDSMFGQKVSVFSNEEPGYRKVERRDVEEDEREDYEDEEDNQEVNKFETSELEEDELYNAPENGEFRAKKENGGMWSPSRFKQTKESSKEKYKKMLEERLAELMKDTENLSKFGQQHGRASSQIWPRNVDSISLNTTKQTKSRNPTKHSIDVNPEIYGYPQNIRERQGSQPKVNSFYSSYIEENMVWNNA